MNGRLPRQPIDRRAILTAGTVALAGVGLGACDVLSVNPAAKDGADSDKRAADKPVADRKEAPALDKRVRSGALPSLAERLPRSPLVIHPTGEAGEYGGTWHNVIGGSSETTFILDKIGYDYLATWSLDWSEVLPNVARDIEATRGGREHVVTLREGMKWSDGNPFTSRDLLFVYQDVFTDKELFPAGAPLIYRDRSGTPARVTADGDHVVRFTFAEPNPLFLQELATSGGDLTGYPVHYLRQFHAKYAHGAVAKAEGKGYDTIRGRNTSPIARTRQATQIFRLCGHGHSRRGSGRAIGSRPSGIRITGRRTRTVGSSPTWIEWFSTSSPTLRSSC